MRLTQVLIYPIPWKKYPITGSVGIVHSETDTEGTSIAHTVSVNVNLEAREGYERVAIGVYLYSEAKTFTVKQARTNAGQSNASSNVTETKIGWPTYIVCERCCPQETTTE